MTDQDPDLQDLERIYDALEGGEPESALRLARETLAREPDEPVVRFLCGLACLDLDRAGEAVIELQHAVRIDPEDAEFRAQLSYALFREGRFDKAREHSGKARELNERIPDAHYTAGLLAERRGEFTAADAHFERASNIDVETFPMPVRLTDGDFELVLEEARGLLNETFRKHLADIAVSVETLPADEVLFETASPLDPELLGLFVGVPLSERSSFSPGGELPPRILLFKRNLERIFPESEMLREEIVRTLHHELGHYLGLDEEELEAIDLG